MTPNENPPAEITVDYCLLCSGEQPPIEFVVPVMAGETRMISCLKCRKSYSFTVTQVPSP